MKSLKIKFTALPIIIFLTAFVWLAPRASAQILTPGELIYSRAANVGENCSTGAIWAVGQDGSNDRFITQGHHPRISPDGRYLIFKRFHPSSLCSPFSIAPEWWIRDLARRTETQLNFNSQSSSGHFFSPETNRDGRQIIFNDGSAICGMNRDGTNKVCGFIPTLDPIRGGGHPSVRGADNLLLVQNFLDNADGGLYTLNYDTLQNRQKIPNTIGRDLNPSWSNDGLKIAFAAYPTGRSEPYYFTNLFKINADGSDRTQLTFFTQQFGEGFSYSLIWTKDNQTIINAAKLNGVAGIYKIATDGSGTITQIPITVGAAPEWVGGIAPVYSEQQVASFGGGLTSGDIFSLVGTLGQGFAGQTSIGGGYNFQSGFWSYPLTALSTGGILQFTNTAYSINENGSTATITVTRAGGSDGAVSVSYATSDGTAIAGSDYTAALGMLNWNDGETGDRTFTVAILDDVVAETDETINLTLSNSTGGATLGSPNAATLTILDNEICSYSISPTSQTITGAGGSSRASISTATSCAWTAVSNAAWLTITSGTNGTGNGTVNYTAAANTTSATRSGTLMIAGQILTVNQPVGSTGNTINVSIPTNLTAPANTILTVPVNLSDTTGSNITSFDFRLTYDPAVLTPAAIPVVITGTLSSQFEVNASSPSAGTLIISGFGTSPPAGSGVLLNFKFNTIGASLSCSALSLTNFGFNEGNPAATIGGNGQACISGASVSGTVIYGSGAATTAVPGVTLTVAGTPSVSTAVTDASGNYTLSGFGAGAYTVTPSKTGDSNNAITSFDASQISKHLVQTVTLTPQQLAAADVSGNGAVTSFDASLIAQTVLGIPNSGNAGTWRFIPVNRSYSNLTTNLNGENYAGVLMGDVSGNWTPPSGFNLNFINPEDVPEQQSADAVSVGLPVKNVGFNSSFTVPVLVGDTTGRSISSFDFEVLFDPSVIEPQTQAVANTGSLSGEFAVGANIIAPGRLRVSGYGATNLAGSGRLINMNFRTVGSAGARTELKWNGFLFNEGNPAANLVNGQLNINSQSAAARFDFEGDGRADIAVFRPSNGVWYLNNSTNGFSALAFGSGTDKIAPADYDGDGKTDIAVYRSGVWYLQRSTAGFTGIAFGAAEDIPIPADYDGDGRAELAVYRPSNGVWYIYNLTTNQYYGIAFGAAEDIPVPPDYDGDGKDDLGVFRPSNGVWYLQQSQLGFIGFAFGASGDKPVQADYDGDGKTDIAVFRPSNGVWYLQKSQTGFTGFAFGAGTDLPAAADYDGDGKADIAVFRPANGVWYLQQSTAGFAGVLFGIGEDKPAPNAFVP